MQFNPSLLREQPLEVTNKLTLENSVREQSDSFLYNILEFNDILHKLDVEEKINYYRALAEYSNGNCTELALQEGIVSSIHGFLTKAIQAIIDLFNKFIGFIRGKAGNAAYKKAKESQNEFDSIKHNIDPNSPLAEYKDVKIYVRPSISEVPERYIASSLNNLIDLLYRILEGNEISNTAIEDAYSMAYKAMSKCIVKKRNTYKNNIIGSKEFRECIDSDSCYIDNKNMKIADYLSNYSVLNAESSAKEAANKLASIRSVIEKAESALKTKSAAMDPSNRELATKIITYCKNISSDAVWYFDKITNFDLKASLYWKQVYESAKYSNMKESGTIHGELFNSDTLFDNDDIRDFNRTEWLDLELTTECFEMSFVIQEYKRKVAANEAIIISENGIDTFRKLATMQEAEAQKLGDKFMEIVQTIIGAVDNFLSNLRDKLSLDANFIKQNRQIIESNPIKLTNMKSNGDILNGLDRIQHKIDLIPYNYDTMKDSLGNEREFFNKFIKGKLNGNLRPGVSWEDTKMTVSEICKAYFGGSMPEDKVAKVDINATNLQSKIKDVTSFLEAPNALMSNIRAELNTLKSQAKKAATEANTAEQPTISNSTQNNQPAQIGNGNEKSTNESMYYSELYQRWFTEADFETPPTTDGSSTAGGENNKSDSKNGFNSYIKAYRSILLAKLTGAGFVRSELMALMKAHVKVYNPKANISNKPDENKNPNQQSDPSQQGNN